MFRGPADYSWQCLAGCVGWKGQCSDMVMWYCWSPNVLETFRGKLEFQGKPDYSQEYASGEVLWCWHLNSGSRVCKDYTGHVNCFTSLMSFLCPSSKPLHKIGLTYMVFLYTVTALSLPKICPKSFCSVLCNFYSLSSFFSSSFFLHCLVLQLKSKVLLSFDNVYCFVLHLFLPQIIWN